MCEQPSTSKYHRVDRDDPNGVERAYKYVRPKTRDGHAEGAITQHLFVSGAKTWIHELHAAVSSKPSIENGESIEPVLTALANATYITQVFNDSHFYASFPTQDDARAAAAAVASTNDSWLAPRFAALRLEAAKLEEEEFRGLDHAEVERLLKKRNRRPKIVTQYADMVEVKQKRGVSDNCSAFVAAELYKQRDGDAHEGAAEGATVSATMTIHERVCGIDGLSLILGFVTPEEEAGLLEIIDANASWDQMARRRVQHYGKKFSYVKRTVDLESDATEIPSMMQTVLLDRVASASSVSSNPFVSSARFDQITVNEYAPGVGLSPHVDTHSAFGDTIISLSLHGGTVMVFRRRDAQPRAVYLPRRSLLIMSGEARWAWEHYIPHRKSDVLTNGKTVTRHGRRVSLTCRTVRRPEEPCRCPFPEACDSQLASIPPTRHMLDALAASSQRERADAGQKLDVSTNNELEASVNRVYNAIAPHFSATRFAVWPRIREFIEAIPRHAIVADVGCGNGKYFGVRDDLFVTGTDRSEGLVRVAHARIDREKEHGMRADVAICDGCHRLPYRRDPPCVDAAICIAVIHHMASVSQRVALIESIGDILRPGGRGFITGWATDQEDQDKVSKWIRIEQTDDDTLSSDNDFFVPWHVPIHRAEKEEYDMSAGEVDECRGTVMFKRYVHLYDPGELEGLVGRARGVTFVRSVFDKDNWCVEFEKDATE